MNGLLLVIQTISDFLWGTPMTIALIGTGLYLSIKFKFRYITKIKFHFQNTFGKMFKGKGEGEGTVSGFAAACTAMANTIGVGNIGGVATAITMGGPGAIFWMWISALLGMGTKFAEVVLAVFYREKDVNGDWVGGPMYYIKNGLGKNAYILAIAYSVLGILTVFGTGNATQVNTITTAIDSALFNYNLADKSNTFTINLVIGIIIAILVGLILIGGIKRIGSVTEKLVPFMAAMYIIMAIILVIINIKSVPGVFASIFEGAFNPKSVTGGIVGSLFLSMRKGVSRGIFSNEAGLGTGSIAHACSDVKHPVQQGLWGIFEVFIDTIVICTLTALVILCSGTEVAYGQAAGADLTINGFVATYGNWISIFTAVALCCFAFSTILGWGLYGSRCVGFLFGSKLIKPFMVVYAFVAIIGATMDLGLLWDIADTFNGLMIIPNLIAVFMLSGTVVKLTREYFQDGPGKFGVETGKEN